MADYFKFILSKKIYGKRIHKDEIIAVFFMHLAKLKALSLHGCNISEKGKELITAILAKTTSLKKFDMSDITSNATTTIAIIRVLKNLTSLKSLNLSKLDFYEAAANDIVQVILNNSLLEDLNISYNSISVGIFHIVVALSTINSIKSLDISSNGIKTEYIEDVTSALAQCFTLKDLDISNNLLTFSGIVKIAEGLRGHQNLQTLNLSNNITVFNPESEFLVDVILSINQSLVYLNVSGRSIRPRFTKDHFVSPPDSELTTAKFPLQNLCLSQYPSFDFFTFRSRRTHVPEKYIRADKERCPSFGETVVSYYVDYDGGTFYNPDHDFAIVVPPGAVSQAECVEIKTTANFFDPYQFPNKYHPVSSFFWLSSDYTFKIPVYLIMSHFAVINNLNDMNQLCVLQASEHDANLPNKRKLVVKEISNGLYFDCEIKYCVFKTQHFCSFSVQDKGNLSKFFQVFCYDYVHHTEDDGEEYITEVCFCPHNCDCSKVCVLLHMCYVFNCATMHMYDRICKKCL